MATPHNHPISYGRKFADCPRCAELAAGAPPVKATWFHRVKAASNEARLAEIRAHDCARSKCGPVCTAFDW